MGFINEGTDEVRLEKSIVISAAQAKNMEARGEILRSDDYIDHDRGENLAPAQFVQETVDANTAAKMAAARGITLASSVDAAAGINFGGGNNGATQTGKSKLPEAILESFRKQPPLTPQPQSTAADFNPEFIASVQEANRRLNKAGGEVVHRIPQNASKETLNEFRTPSVISAPQYYNTPQNPYVAPVYQQSSSQNIDYSVMAALMKDAVREVIKEVNLKDIVKEVLKEEREVLNEKSINENIAIKIGDSVFSGKISAMKTVAK